MKKLNDFFYKLLKKGNKVYYSILEENYYISDGIVVGIFNKEDILINLDKCKQVDFRIFDFSNLVYELQQIKHVNLEDGMLLTELSDGTFIKNKYLDLFNNYTIMSSGSTSPVKIECDGCVKGYILPIRKY